MTGDVEDARVDLARTGRTTIPEVIFGETKTVEQIERIARTLYADSGFALATRVNPAAGAALVRVLPEARYFERARILQCGRMPVTGHRIAVACAGTSDIAVAEEASRTLEAFGHEAVERFDIGVAGIHRTFAVRDDLDACRAIIVVAGMEGALPSVIAGLVRPPVIAVPTSVGYGAAFGGLAALLTMLNSCAPGIAVVNIDSGFNAACFAHKIVAGTPA
jgi:NCAIR mutase (PurE)-related protein